MAPTPSEIDDLHWLAYDLFADTRRAFAAGVTTSMAWIRGGRVGPVTDRDEQPVTRNLADAERWAAEAARDPLHPPPLDVIYEDLGVAWWAPVAVDPGYAVGVWNALRWVLGALDQKPPLLIPRRHPDGRVFTAQDLYRAATGGDDTHHIPERRHQLRVRAEVDATRYATLAAKIDSVKHRLTS